MTKSTKSLAPTRRHTVYVDDEEANHFTTDTLRVYCEHTIDGARRTSKNRRLFEIVPSLSSGPDPQRGSRSKGSGRGRKGGERHSGGGREATEKVTFVYGGPLRLASGEGEFEEGPGESGKRSYVLTCKATSPNLALADPDFWKALKEPNEYEIEGIDGETFEVKAYCPDRYKLAFDFPPMRKISGGVMITEREDKAEKVERDKRRVEVEAQSATWKPVDQKLETVDTKASATSDGEVRTEESRETKDAPVQAIRVRRNDTYVEADVVNLVSNGLNLAAQIQEMISLVQDNAPKFGWYFEAEAQAMQGTLNFEWGWREYARAGQEHRAFYWLSLNADFTLVQVSFEIGVGVEGFGFELQVYGRIEGAVTLKAALQRVSPAGDAGLTADLKGEIVGALGARFKVPYLVDARGAVKTKLIMEGQLCARQDDGLRMTMDSYWTGVKAVVSWSAGARTKVAGYRQEGSKEVEVISPPPGQEKGFELGQWTWPEGSRYAPDRIPRSEVEAVFEDTFSAGWVVLGGEYDIRVREHGRKKKVVSHWRWPDTHEPDYDWWSMQDVVGALLEKLQWFEKYRGPLRMGRKNVEAMALDIRQRLQAKMEAHMESYNDEIPFRERQQLLDWKRENGTPHLRAADYEAFLETELPALLEEKYVDPVQEKINQIEQAA